MKENMPLPFPKKIMIFGRPGSGKSTFAFALHQKTGLPLHHLDQYFYQANWIERDLEEFLAIQQVFVEKDQWIIDGNSTKSLEMRYKHAHLALYFNFPRWRCFLRILKRLWRKDPKIQDRALGCSETIRFSLLKYMWTFEHRVQSSLEILQEKYPHVVFREIKSDQDLQHLWPQLFPDRG